MQERGTSQNRTNQVEIWVEQLSGPARALDNWIKNNQSELTGNRQSPIKIVQKHLPDLTSDTLDLFVFLRDLKASITSSDVIVLTYTPNMQQVCDYSFKTAERVNKNGINTSPDFWQEYTKITGINKDTFLSKQDFLLDEIGRFTAKSDGIIFQPVMANTILFVWNKQMVLDSINCCTPVEVNQRCTTTTTNATEYWSWSDFYRFIRELQRSAHKTAIQAREGLNRPLAMCGIREGGLAFYEWTNFVGGHSEQGNVLLPRGEESVSIGLHGWEPRDLLGYNPRDINKVLERNRRPFARFAQVISHYAHKDFLDIDQESQLDLILNWKAAAGFVWSDQLTRLEEDELSTLGIWPVPGKRAILSGAAALVPYQSDRTGNNISASTHLAYDACRAIEDLWNCQYELCAEGMIPADLTALFKYLKDNRPTRDGAEADVTFCQNWERSKSISDSEDHFYRVYCAVWHNLMHREPIVIEGGPLAHRIAGKCTDSIRRMWRSLNENNREKSTGSTIGEIVDIETRIIEYEIRELLGGNGIA